MELRNVAVTAGDIVIIPHGDPHRVTNGKPSELIDTGAFLGRWLRADVNTTRMGGDGEVTHSSVVISDANAMLRDCFGRAATQPTGPLHAYGPFIDDGWQPCQKQSRSMAFASEITTDGSA